MKYLGQPQSGSQANTTASKNRAGQYLRNRRSPSQPAGNGRRAFIRGAFGAASQAWSSLEAAVQLAWNAYAGSFPYTDRLGQAITLTGHQMFVAIATQCQNCGLALPTDPPVDNAVWAPAAPTIVVTAPGTVTITPAGDGGAADFLLISASAPQSSGVSSCKTFCQLTFVAGNSVAAVDLGALYVAQFGNMAAGQRVFFSFTPVNQYGVTGVPVTAMVAAA